MRPIQIAAVFCVLTLSAAISRAEDRTAETRALAYLSHAVPDWPRRNRCHSCHNNGDAARALYQAVRDGRSIEGAALDENDDWLRRPERWTDEKGEETFHDTKLARLQFTLALSAAFHAGRIADGAPVRSAVEAVAEQQDADGGWRLAPDVGPGSPTTYGRALSTALIVDLLRDTDETRHRGRIERGRAWFLARPVVSVLDASSTLLVLGSRSGKEVEAKRRQALGILREGRSGDGGWGLYPNDPPTVFDTAIALLALDRLRDAPDGWIAAGRGFLRTFQDDDGSWPETTRPSGGVSYAQRVSTTAWAFLALEATR